VTDRTELPFSTRLWFAFACFFRVLFDGTFAARVFAAHRDESLSTTGQPERALPTAEPAAPLEPDSEAAFQLLGLLQREGRLLDFLQQDIAAFSDSDVGAAARVVHEGCRKALFSHAEVSPVRQETEGSRIRVDPGFDASTVKLTGNVGGSPPFTGVLRHRGWRVERLELPRRVGDHDVQIVAPAEVEL
jgi:hypothetical protein